MIKEAMPTDMSEFQRGALYALKLLKTQLEARRDVLRKTGNGLDTDVSGMLHSTSNLLTGVQIQFEMQLVKELSDDGR